MPTLADKLANLGACPEAVEWAKTQRTHKKAWASCQRGDWMLWLLGKLSTNPESKQRKQLVQCACQCARLALPYVIDSKDRPKIAIETAEAWCAGEASLSDVHAAADAAYAAYAAYSAAYAVRLKQCADIVRQHYPTPPRLP